MKRKRTLKKKALLAVACLAGAVIACALLMLPRKASADGGAIVAKVVRGPFRRVLHRCGKLQPVNEEHIVAHIWGQITELAAQGGKVQAGDVVLRLDATPYEDQKEAHEAYICKLHAQFKREQLIAEKAVNQAVEDAASYELRVSLEKMRLQDLKKGPAPADAIEARMTKESAQALFSATRDEAAALETLLPVGCISEDVVRLKRLDQDEQQFKAVDAQISEEKLNTLDEVVIAAQELKLRDAEKMRNTAVEKLALLRKNLARDNDNRALTLKRANARLQQLIENIEKTVYRAPAAGIVIHKPGRYYSYQPGRDVNDAAEIMSIPDFSRMKVAMTVDEANVSNVVVGLSADVTPFGWEGPPLTGKVTRVTAKGRDEFELYAEETTAITGTANRQVFDVDVALDGNAPAFVSGLNAEVDVVLCSLDALQIPRIAIVRNAGHEPMVSVVRNGKIELRKIKILEENQFKAAVEGLEEGECVALAPDAGANP